MKKNKKIIILMVVLAVVVGGVSFYAGTQHKSTMSRTSQGGPNDMQGFRNGGASRTFGMSRGGGSFAGGEVISKDATSMTVKGRDGSSKVVFFTQATPVMKMVAGTNTDIKEGTEVTITGTTNPDGSVTAQSISVRSSQADQKPN